MTTRLVDNPNSTSANIMDNLKGIINQSKENSKYDQKAPSFKTDLPINSLENDENDENKNIQTIEEFFTLKNFMFDKILIILIIGLLAIFIMKAMDFL